MVDGDVKQTGQFMEKYLKANAKRRRNIGAADLHCKQENNNFVI